jgi:hypothetical protein
VIGNPITPPTEFIAGLPFYPNSNMIRRILWSQDPCKNRVVEIWLAAS